MREGRDQLGFFSFCLWSNPVRANAGLLEDAIQKQYQELLKLGQRLWRFVAKGCNPKLAFPLNSVFLTVAIKTKANAKTWKKVEVVR